MWIQKIIKTVNSKGGIFTFIRAQFSSQVSSWFDFLVSIVCVNVFGIYFGLSTMLGNISGGLMNYLINYKWTFKASGQNIKYTLIKFGLVWAGSIFLNTQATILFTDYLMEYIPTEDLPNFLVENLFLIPKIIVSSIIGWVWNYNMQRIFVYKDLEVRVFFQNLTSLFCNKKTKND